MCWQVEGITVGVVVLLMRWRLVMVGMVAASAISL
jgi:hypothetical protein